MLGKVKTALRITHNYLDNDILDTIATSRMELIRSGVAVDVANSDDELIERAIKTYCLSVYAPDLKERDGYALSFAYQCDNLRKSANYGNL